MRLPVLAPTLLAVLTAALLGACGEPTARVEDTASAESRPARTWPAGCVLAVDDVPIFADEIDEASAWIAMIEPRSAAPHLRRLALTNVVLPRVLAGLIAPDERTQALEEAEALLASLRSDAFPGVPNKEGALGTVLEGTWQDLGIPAWGAALELPNEQWSEVVEDTGSFAVFRILDREPAPVAQATRFKVDLFGFPFLPSEAGAEIMERAYDEHTLTIVDEAWRELVPELTQYRMGAHETSGS